MEIDESGGGWLAGNRVELKVSPRSPSPGNYRANHGPSRSRFSNPFSRLDLNTTLEQFFFFTSIVLLGAAFFAVTPDNQRPHWFLGQVLCSISSILMALRMVTDCTYFLDNQRNVLVYSRSIFGFGKAWQICEFNEVRQVGMKATYVKTKYSHYYTYAVVIELPNGTCIPVSPDIASFSESNSLATSLANHFGSGLVESHHELTSLSPNQRKVIMTPIEGPWDQSSFWGHPGVWDVITFIISIVFTVVVFIPAISR